MAVYIALSGMIENPSIKLPYSDNNPLRSKLSPPSFFQKPGGFAGQTNQKTQVTRQGFPQQVCEKRRSPIRRTPLQNSNTTALADQFRPIFGMEKLAGRLIQSFISMSSKEVTLRLQKVRWKAFGTVAIVIGK